MLQKQLEPYRYVHRRAGLPFVKVSAVRKAGIINPNMNQAEIEVGGLKRNVKLWHMRFPKGGSWSYFICPHCSRRCQILRLYDGRFTCRLCDGLGRDRGKSIERIRQILAKPIGAKPYLKRRTTLEVSLRRALIAKRRQKLHGWPPKT